MDLKFATMDEALNWMIEEELDKFFSTRRSAPTVKVFNCCLNNESTTRNPKKTKKVLTCLARITMKEVELCNCTNPKVDRCMNPSRVIQVKGCTKHSHAIEKRNLRLSKKTKDRVADLLRSGLRSDVVLERYFDSSNENSNSKPVTMADINGIINAYNLHGYDSKASEVQNVTAFMGDPSFRGFNFGKLFDMSAMPEDVKSKVVSTSGYFLLCYASDAMIRRFRNHPTTIAIDGTHNTNAAKYILITIMIFDSRSEGSPAFQCLVENENKSVFSDALRVLNALAPDACSNVKVLLSDSSHTFINSWRAVANSNVTWSACHWHLERSWAKHIKNPQMYQDIKNLRYITRSQDFSMEWTRIKTK